MRTFTLTLAAALAAPALCLADPDTPAGAAQPSATDVAGVVVTAVRTPTVIADTPDATVITRRDIDARQATFAADVLDTTPGLSVKDDGAFGGVTSVSMRGASTDKTLVLIDGVPQNDPSSPSGAYDFSTLDLADVDRIEILSGPQSSLWGSSAIGGVISVTTRELDGWRLQGEGGSLSTFDGSAGIGTSNPVWALGATGSIYSTNGISKADGFPERDAFHTWNAGAYGRWTPLPIVSFDARLRYTNARIDDDGYNATTFDFGDTPEYDRDRTWTGSARAIVQGPLGFTNTVTFGAFDTSRTHIYPGVAYDSSAYWGARQDYRWLAQRGAADDPFGVAFGIEHEDDEASISTGQHFRLGATSGFATVRWRPVAPLTVSGAIRYDAAEGFSGQATGRAAAVLKLGAGFSLEGSWGQGFKTPTISEIACDFCDPGSATPLKAEHAEGWDGGLAWTSADGGVLAKVTFYRLAVRDQIEFTDAPPFHYINVDRTRTNGIEASLDGRLTPHLTLQAGYAYTDAIDVDAMTQLLRVPRNSGSVGLDWHDGPWQAAFTLRGEGPDADEDPTTFAPATRPGFVVADVDGSYAIRPGLELTAKVQNAGDTHYEEVLGYGEPRLMVLFGVRAKG